MEKKTIFVFNGVIVDSAGRILIENRSEKELPSADQKWGLPGGKIEFGETPEEAVVREAREETGCEVRIKEMIPLTYTSVWHYPDKEQHTIVFCYFGELVSIVDKEIHDKKINTIKWIFPGDMSNYSFLPGVPEAINYSIEHFL